MKKLFFALFASLIAINASAQFGIIGGLTSSSTDVQTAFNDLKSKNINLYHVGITYKGEVGNILAIQPALIYNVKGASMNDIAGVSDIEFKTGYIELPIQIQAGFGIGKIIRIFALGEPFIGYAITNDTKINVQSVETAKDSWNNIKTRIEYGVSLGAGVELFKHLQVSAKYFWNFGNVYGGTIDLGAIQKTIKEGKCNGISLSAAILF